jgi:sodium/bile acid cotransporter 7
MASSWAAFRLPIGGNRNQKAAGKETIAAPVPQGEIKPLFAAFFFRLGNRVHILMAMRFAGLLALAIVLAILWPGPGSDGGWLHPDKAKLWAVLLIFFFNGLTLKTSTIGPGLAQWRVHLFVHIALFVVGPALAWVIARAASGWISPDLALGIFYLGALPCAISTAVIYTANAGGNATAALFNSTVANLLGVVLVPLLVASQLEISGDRGEAMMQMIMRTAGMVFPPLFAGQLARIFCRSWVDTRRSWFGKINSSLILFLTYLSFAQSVSDGVWASTPLQEMAVLALAVGVFFLCLTAVTALAIRWVGFAFPEAVAALMCSILKTLAAGIPLAAAIFRDTQVETGVVLIPLLLYFMLSLAAGSVFVRIMHDHHTKSSA